MKTLNKTALRLTVLLTTLLCVSCTDGEKARLASYGNGGTITCYSGGQQIYAGKSTGKINANREHAGFEFVDEKTKTFVRVNGDCVVNN